LCANHGRKKRLGGGLSEGMRVIVPLLLSLAMWAFILLGLAGLWLKIFGR
jgi:hypothetical protein